MALHPIKINWIYRLLWAVPFGILHVLVMLWFEFYFIKTFLSFKDILIQAIIFTFFISVIYSFSSKVFLLQMTSLFNFRINIKLDANEVKLWETSVILNDEMQYYCGHLVVSEATVYFQTYPFNYNQKILVIPLKNLEDFIIKENESKKLCILRAIKLDGKILDFEMKNSQVGLIKINTILDHHQFVSVK
jgi:hypothetical protein